MIIKIILNFYKKIIILIFYLRAFKNSLKNIINRSYKSFFLPNISIKNIIFINPNKIKFKNAIPLKYKNKSTPFILNFDWDKKNQIFSEFEKQHHTYITCKQLFIKGLKIQDCKEYFFFKKQIKKFGIFKGCKNEEDVILYLKKLVRLFENIKIYGIMTKVDNNLEFMIDRNSNLVKIGGGNHRFAISKILKLKKIPIEIKVINSKYLNKNYHNKISTKDLNKIIKKVEKKYN